MRKKLISIQENPVPIIKLPAAKVSRDDFKDIPQHHLETFWEMFSEYPDLLDEEGNINLNSDNFSKIYDWLKAKIESSVKITINEEIEQFCEKNKTKFSYSSSRRELYVKGEITEEEAGELEGIEMAEKDKNALKELIKLSREIIPGQEIYQELLKTQRKEFDKMILNSEGKKLVLFWQQGCGSCRAAIGQFLAYKDYIKGDMEIYTASVEENILVHKEYKDTMKGTPALLMFTNGKLKHTVLGFKSMKEYTEAFGFKVVGTEYNLGICYKNIGDYMDGEVDYSRHREPENPSWKERIARWLRR